MGHLLKDGKHFTVGAIITRSGITGKEYLLINRVKPPLGWACDAGHVDEGNDSLTTLKKEVKEEAGVDVVHYDPVVLGEYLEWNICPAGKSHEWDVYSVEVAGEFDIGTREARDSGWYTVEGMRKLNLGPVWKYFFEKLRII